MRHTAPILISGAGIAGLTAAYWLHRHGFPVRVVEQRPDLSDPGYMIDFYGPGYDVAERMGLLDSLRARHYPIPRMDYVDKLGRRNSSLDIERFRALLDGRHFNFMRGDLEAVLYEAVRGDVPISFGTHITHIHPQPEAVQVQLSDGSCDTYSLLVGADGIHSSVRRLLWGEERRYERFLGCYVACAVIDNFLRLDHIYKGHLEPGVHAAVYTIRGGRLATFFAFRSPRLPQGGREVAEAALHRAFDRCGWIAPQLVAASCQAPQLYFDPVSQIAMPSWHRGRAVLIGDACQCLTLLAGQGASLAMAGAGQLAHALRQADGDLSALVHYQHSMRPDIVRRQQEARALMKALVPGNRLSLWMTHCFMRMAFMPGMRSLLLHRIGAHAA